MDVCSPRRCCSRGISPAMAGIIVFAAIAGEFIILPADIIIATLCIGRNTENITEGLRPKPKHHCSVALTCDIALE